MRNHWLLLCLFALLWDNAYSQTPDSVLVADENFLSSDDSLSIFQLIDSLMQMDDEPSSQMVVRLSYNSNVLSAGRTLGIQEFGLSPGISYYHKTGLYADITTYYSNNYEPKFYLTTFSGGYLKVFSKYFSLLANYDYYRYDLSEELYIPYNHSLNISPSLDFKNLTLRLDYGYYFGDKQSNRIMPSLSYTFQTKQLKHVDRISFMPFVSVIVGDEHYTKIEYIKPKGGQNIVENIRKYGTPFQPVVTEESAFGVLNYAFSAPITVTKKNWMFNLSYTYTIPKAVADELLTLENTGYVSASLIYSFSLRRKQESL